MEIFNKESTENLVVILLARSLGEDLSEVLHSGNCVKLYPEQFNGFANEGSELAFSMVIEMEKSFVKIIIIIIIIIKDMKI